jgi:hypothetical protein
VVAMTPDKKKRKTQKPPTPKPVQSAAVALKDVLNNMQQLVAEADEKEANASVVETKSDASGEKSTVSSSSPNIVTKNKNKKAKTSSSSTTDKSMQDLEKLTKEAAKSAAVKEVILKQLAKVHNWQDEDLLEYQYNSDLERDGDFDQKCLKKMRFAWGFNIFKKWCDVVEFDTLKAYHKFMSRFVKVSASAAT